MKVNTVEEINAHFDKLDAQRADAAEHRRARRRDHAAQGDTVLAARLAHERRNREASWTAEDRARADSHETAVLVDGQAGAARAHQLRDELASLSPADREAKLDALRAQFIARAKAKDDAEKAERRRLAAERRRKPKP